MYRSLAALVLVTLAGTLIVAGCTSNTPTNTDKPKRTPPVAGNTKEDKQDSKETKIQAALAKLDPADRKLAEAQKWCAVQTKNRLGTMGAPVKVMVNGEPVFLCCESCEEDAKDHAEKTLAAVAENKKKAAAETKTP